MTPFRKAILLLILNATALGFVIILAVGLYTQSPRATLTYGGTTILGRFLPEGTLDGMIGLLEFIGLLTIIGLAVNLKIARYLRNPGPQPPRVASLPHEPKMATGWKGKLSRGLRITLFVVITVTAIVFPILLIIYLAYSYAIGTLNTSGGSLIALFWPFYLALLADLSWKADSDKRFLAFRTGFNRHRTWLSLNSMLSLFATFEVMAILFGVGLAAEWAYRFPSLLSQGDPLELAALLGFIYFIFMVFRNSLANLVGQGYGKSPIGVGRILGTSIVGVAALAKLARGMFLHNRIVSGREYFKKSIGILEDTLTVRRVKLDKLDELGGLLSFVGAFRIPVDQSALAGLAEEFGTLTPSMDSFDKLAQLSNSIARFVGAIQWPGQLSATPKQKRSKYELATLLGILVAAIVGVVAFVSTILGLGPSLRIALTPTQALGDGFSIVMILAFAVVSYGPYSRLSSASVDTRDFRGIDFDGDVSDAE